MAEVTRLQVRIDTELMGKAEKLLAEIGLDAPSGVRLLFKEVVERGALPFSWEQGAGGTDEFFNNSEALDPEDAEDAEDAEAYVDRSVICAAKGEWDKAIAGYTEALRLDPEYVLAHLLRAYAYKDTGDLRPGPCGLEQALWLDPHDRVAQINLDLLRRQGC